MEGWLAVGGLEEDGEEWMDYACGMLYSCWRMRYVSLGIGEIMVITALLKKTLSAVDSCGLIYGQGAVSYVRIYIPEPLESGI